MNKAKSLLAPLFKGLAKYTDKGMQLFYVITTLVVLGILNKSCDADIQGDFAIYEKNEKTGTVEFFKFNAKKVVPPVKNKNLLSVYVDNQLNRTVYYQRHVMDVFSLNVYAGAGLGQDPLGKMTYSVGVTVSF